MNYVIQNFYFFEKKIHFNLRIRYLLLLNNVSFFFHIYHFFFSLVRLEPSMWLIWSNNLLNKTVTHYQTSVFYKLTIYKPLNLSNNLYLSSVYWNLNNFFFFFKNKLLPNNRNKLLNSTIPFFDSIKINSSEINKNFYDKIIYFYFLTNHLIWFDFVKTYNIILSYLIIHDTYVINSFYNSLFLPIHNF